MDKKSDEQLLVIQAMLVANEQDSYGKMMKLTADLTGMIVSMVDQIKMLKSSPENMHSPKAQDPSSMFPSNNKASPLEGVHSMKIGVMWTLKHKIRSPKFY